jgi:3-phytase
MELFAAKVANYSKQNPNKKVGSGPLSFLNDWEYMLGENLLLPSGAATEATAGALFWSQYGRLLYRAGPGDATYDSSMNVFLNGTARQKPTFRTTDYPRILESARWWLSKPISL